MADEDQTTEQPTNPTGDQPHEADTPSEKSHPETPNDAAPQEEASAKTDRPVNSSPPLTEASLLGSAGGVTTLGTTRGVGAFYAATKPAREASGFAKKVDKQTKASVKQLTRLAKAHENLSVRITEPVNAPTSRIGRLRKTIRIRLGVDDNVSVKAATKNLNEVERLSRQAEATAKRNADTTKKLIEQAKKIGDENVAKKMTASLEKTGKNYEAMAKGTAKTAENAKTAAGVIKTTPGAITTESNKLAGQLDLNAVEIRQVALNVAKNSKNVVVASKLARGAKLLEGFGKYAGWVGVGLTVVGGGIEINEARKTGDGRQMYAAVGDVSGTVAGGAGGYVLGSWIGTGVGAGLGFLVGGAVGFLAGGVGAVPGAALGASWGATGGNIVGGLVGAWFGASKGGEAAQKIAANRFDAAHPGYKAPGKPGNDAPVNAKNADPNHRPANAAEWTAFNLARLKGFDSRKAQHDNAYKTEMEKIAKGYGFEGGVEQAHKALNDWGVDSTGMHALMAAAKTRGQTIEAFLHGRKGGEALASLDGGQQGGNVAGEQRHARRSPLGPVVPADENTGDQNPVTARNESPAPIRQVADQTLHSTDNFGGNPQMASLMESIMKTAKDSTGKLYADYDDVKAADASKQATMIWQHVLIDGGYYDKLPALAAGKTDADGIMLGRTRQASLEYAKAKGVYNGDAISGDAFDTVALNALNVAVLKNVSQLEGPIALATIEPPQITSPVSADLIRTPASPDTVVPAEVLARAQPYSYRDAMPSSVAPAAVNTDAAAATTVAAKQTNMKLDGGFAPNRGALTLISGYQGEMDGMVGPPQPTAAEKGTQSAPQAGKPQPQSRFSVTPGVQA